MQAATDSVDRLFSGETVLCDGAMGTMLYSCGVFINRSYDELNVTQPEVVRSVHEGYLQAGAQVIETNTFGANAFRLEQFGLREKVAEFNRAGAAIARQCVDAIREKQATEAFVAGAVGSLGVKLAPAGTVTLAEARAAFAEQITALAAGKVDLLILETMMSLRPSRPCWPPVKSRRTCAWWCWSPSGRTLFVSMVRRRKRPPSA